MRKIFPLLIIMVFLMCGCETTARRQSPQGKAADGPEKVTIGGEITVRGQYLIAD